MSRLIERFGGRHWVSEADAIELICERTGCTASEAQEALDVWRHDGRVKSRAHDGGLISFAQVLNLLPRNGAPIKSIKQKVSEIDVADLEAILAQDSGKAKYTGGRPAGYDWISVKMILERECQKRGLPDRKGDDLQWQTLADACRLVRDEMKWDADKGPSDSQLRDKVKGLLDGIQANTGN
jgi:hypothetical protein